MKRFHSILLLALSLLLQACTTTAQNRSLHPLLADAVNYKDSINEQHPDHFNQLFYVPEDFKVEIKERFGHLQSTEASSAMANWLISEDGFDLVYDIQANLVPSETLQQKRGNCLSFTLLIIELARSLNITIKANQVDLPGNWGESGEEDLVFYRHVNGVIKRGLKTQILDLAISDYNFAYPQRVITKPQSAALMYSNKGIDALRIKDFETAFHYLRLAVSYFPENPDMWINLGALYKAQEKFKVAEVSYLHALKLRDKNNLAASNLERLYRVTGETHKAQLYAKKAEKARRKNPYYLFKIATQQFFDMEYDAALGSVNKAIKQHKKDHRFFALRSKIHRARNYYIDALEDLARATLVASHEGDINRYQEKAHVIVARLQSGDAIEESDRKIKINKDLPFRHCEVVGC